MAAELDAATLELQTIRQLCPTLAASVGAAMDAESSAADRPETRQADKTARAEDGQPEEGGREAKWHKPGSKGGNNPKGKGVSGNSSSDKWTTWKKEWNHYDKQEQGQLKQLKQQVEMLSTLVLRHENQLQINRQDTAFVFFMWTDLPNNLAVSTYTVAKVWKETKANSPEKLQHPLRVILFQHLLMTVASRLEALELERQEAGLDPRRRGALHRDEMECGSKEARPGQNDSVSAGAGCQADAAGSSHFEQGAVCSEPLPCYPTSVGGISKSYFDIHPGSRLANPGSQQDLADHEQFVSDLSVGSSRGVLPPRDASEIRAGYQSGAEYLRQFRRAIFGNSGFHCYTNAVMRCILWNMCDLEEARESFGEALHDVIQGALQTGAFHFWRRPKWQEVMVGWRSPDQ